MSGGKVSEESGDCMDVEIGVDLVGIRRCKPLNWWLAGEGGTVAAIWLVVADVVVSDAEVT